jgi:hypothetical protein
VTSTRALLLLLLLGLLMASMGWAQSCNTLIPPPHWAPAPPQPTNPHVPAPPLPGMPNCDDTLTNGLVGWWKFDEGSGTTAADSSGNGNSLSLGGGTFPSWVAGHKGNALSFSGSDYLRSAADIDLKMAAGTVTAWFKSPSAADQKVVSIGSSEFIHPIAMDSGTTRTCWYEPIPDDGGCETGATVNDGNWHFMAVVYNGTTINTYLDNSPAPDITYGPFLTTYEVNDKLMIGATSGGAYRFSGEIDEIRVYSRALSLDEISAIYNY